MKLTYFLILLLFSCASMAQRPASITDEDEVPAYQSPELLKSKTGKKIKSVKKWEKSRRPEILKLFTQEIYGEIPGEIEISSIHVFDEDENALDGTAIRKQVELSFEKNGHKISFDILIYLPKSEQKAPIFLGLNFYGNHTIDKDPNIRLTESWAPDNPSIGIIHNQITEQSRGASSNRWPVKKILEAGYGLATIYCGDIDPDWNDFSNGVHPLLYKEGQMNPRVNEWGAISAWSWGLSRALDYFETDEDIDEEKVVVVGHSRLGKTSLWAAAQDQRFAICVSNESGCMGAALSRRRFGETVGRIAYTFPYWFCDNIKKYAGLEGEMPVDQHMLLALIAPRPLYVASAKEDLWSDPKGEFLSALYASPAYKLYDLEGLPATEMPDIEHPVMGSIGYHIRNGKHNLTDYDWDQFIKFANMHFIKAQP
ncbi:glucuronyl esterase domain-containing protein [Sunxiuqinia sp. A32]|uniref:glucuronyl esterase domain-containing protein n=1 Tax=Sunxiuqinia sp. A32 TaxID=3461496 RepID=UPI0040461A1D